MSNFKLDNMRLDTIIEQEEIRKKNSYSPTSNDIEHFQKQLNNNELDEKTKHTNNTEHENPLEQNNNTLPSFTFEKFFSITKSPELKMPILQDTEMQEKLIESILVSQPNEKGQEIRIKLNADILLDTEIRLIKHLDGKLSIEMFTQNANSFQTLVTNQFKLKERLEQLNKHDISININNYTQNENDTNQQSRGYIDYLE